MMKWYALIVFFVLAVVCFCCKGNECASDEVAAVRSVSESDGHSCIVQWVTTSDDFVNAVSAGFDANGTGFVIGNDSLLCVPCDAVPVEGHKILSAVDVRFPHPMLSDFKFIMVCGSDTLFVDIWGSVPLKDGGLVNIISPITCEVGFDIVIDPSFDGSVSEE